MEWMALEEIRQKEEAKIKKVYDKVWNKAFEDVQDVWRLEKNMFLKNTDMSNVRRIQVDWSGVDDNLDKQSNDKKLADFSPEWSIV